MRWWWWLQAHILKIKGVEKLNVSESPIEMLQNIFATDQMLLFFHYLSFFCLFFLNLSTFNPSDYTANSGARQETWEGDGNETAEGSGRLNIECYILTFYPPFLWCCKLMHAVNYSRVQTLFFLGTWGGNLEDWNSEDWNEDVRQHF